MIRNLNDLSIKICQIEGKKKEVNIAQVKEILKIITDLIEQKELDIKLLTNRSND